MLIEQTHFPLGQSGNIPWGTIIFVSIVVGGIAFVGYQAMKPTVIIPKPKTKENERE